MYINRLLSLQKPFSCLLIKPVLHFKCQREVRSSSKFALEDTSFLGSSWIDLLKFIYLEINEQLTTIKDSSK